MRGCRLIASALAAAVIALTAKPANVSIKEYDVPTPHSRPHDPALAPDGSLSRLLTLDRTAW